MCLLGTSPGASDLIPETLSISRKNTQNEMKRSGDGNEKWQQRNTKETKILSKIMATRSKNDKNLQYDSN